MSLSPAPVANFRAGLDDVLHELAEARAAWRAAHPRNAEHGVAFPSREALASLLRQLGAALFPLRLGPPEVNAGNEARFIAACLETQLDRLHGQVVLEQMLAPERPTDKAASDAAERIVGDFAASLAALRRLIDSDVEAAYRIDPAARSVDEVLLCYPGLLAVIHHRIAHRLFTLGAPIVARTIAAIALERTGIDIHPGAQIGPSLFIDHGSGVVIGETSRIGARVHLHQGVTLGGRGRGPGRRHPRLGDDVVIHAGATLVGPITLGAGCVVEGNIWLAQDVPPAHRVAAPPPQLLPR
ncbi:serine O-acetyltransferase EpsC [Sphingomonas morindae]|uniref:Serine acetyltransferase n=1 Tax=Sphingomonas morindae TaxID=1541170 RepID=A0ABY4X605_9SPHN|nr:serine O-acetyltransferase EpsC [Sphingomonas morindae]USI72344.1 serine acetyltransferase [Sphingomonas morindae]